MPSSPLLDQRASDGFILAVLGSTISWGLYFYFYNNAKQRYLKSRDKTGARIHLASAAEAGGFVCLITNPVWVVKTRLQLQTPQTQFRPYTGVGGMLDIFYVLPQSFEELKEARARDKKLFEEAKEENRKQYEEKLKSHALTMKEEMVKEANAKIAEMFAQYTQQLPIPFPFLIISAYEFYLDVVSFNAFSDEVVFRINVLASSVRDWILH
uniref:Folate transporter 1, chloroplastic-like n=1 Tax=Tanacetum cinerariifolium TaxID=118510 RepID=A0A699K6J8_TANCI|nr:folate transporter 1, chloroplastic-like [Tanacetum cinerariifolium]